MPGPPGAAPGHSSAGSEASRPSVRPCPTNGIGNTPCEESTGDSSTPEGTLASPSQRRLRARAHWRRASEVVLTIQLARDRWHTAVQSVITMSKMLRYHRILQDSSADDGDRLYACAQLLLYHRSDTRVASKVRTIRLIVRDASIAELFYEDSLVLGQRLSDAFTPSKMGSHPLIYTYVFPLFCLSLYSYTAADYRNYSGQTYGWHLASVLGEQFDFDFLVTWRGFYLPAVQQGQRDRWVLSVIIHQGLQHILSNMLLYIVLARHLERRYGTWRLVVVSTISGIGGNLFCCLFSDPCTVVVGASGLIFGVAAFWIADLLLHLHEIRGILLQLFLVLVFFVLFLVTIITQPHVSHFSHLGGLLAGLFPSMLFLPSSGGRLPDTVIIAVGLTCTVMFNAILFPVAYLIRLQRNFVC